MDKLSAMSTFAKVVETGSFTRSADALGIPKARVSQRVADLEQHLGVRLLHRTTRALRLTEDGQAYFARCQAILQEIDELEGAVKGAVAEPRGRLRVEALASVARWIIGPQLPAFRERFPRVTLRLGASDRISHLLEDGIDCAIRGGRLEDSSFVGRHAGDVLAGLYASPRHLASAPPIRNPHDLADHPRLSWFAGRRHPFEWTLHSGRRTASVAPADGLLCDDPDVAIAACIAGAGICPGAPFAVEGWVRTGRLVPVLPDWHFPARPIHVVYPDRRHLSARTRCFVEWSMDLLQSSRSLRMSPLELADSIA